MSAFFFAVERFRHVFAKKSSMVGNELDSLILLGIWFGFLHQLGVGVLQQWLVPAFSYHNGKHCYLQVFVLRHFCAASRESTVELHRCVVCLHLLFCSTESFWIERGVGM